MNTMKWRRASDCADGSCVEVAWQSACASSNCVEVACSGGQVLVRDSKLGEESPVIEYSLADWQAAVVDEIKDGGWLPEYSYREDDDAGTLVLRRSPSGTSLRFTGLEWDAFVAGVRRGEFDQPGPEWRSAALADVDPGTETRDGSSAATRELSPVGGSVPADDHPAVRAVLAVTPAHDGVCALDDCAMANAAGDGKPLARKQAAEVLRWLVTDTSWPADHASIWDALIALADTIDPKETTQP